MRLQNYVWKSCQDTQADDVFHILMGLDMNN